MPILILALKLRGMARPDALAVMTGAAPEAIAAQLAALAADGLASESRMGWRLTAAGSAAADAAWATERAGLDAAALAALHTAFHAPNAAFKAIIADWQIRDGQPNDHQNAAHDDAVRARLVAIHAEMAGWLAALAALHPRMARYATRFDAALAGVMAGDNRLMAGPLIDSYHTIWFELHEELIRLSGLTRAAEAAAGRA
jgi:hypothetical protein